MIDNMAAGWENGLEVQRFHFVLDLKDSILFHQYSWLVCEITGHITHVNTGSRRRLKVREQE